MSDGHPDGHLAGLASSRADLAATLLTATLLDGTLLDGTEIIPSLSFPSASQC